MRVVLQGSLQHFAAKELLTFLGSSHNGTFDADFAAVFASGGSVLRTSQTGRVQNYGLAMFGGMAVIALVLVIVPLLRQ